MNFLRSQLIETRKLPYPKRSYIGQTVVITSSNTGLGKEAARHYARLDAKRLVLAVRELEKGNAAKREMQTTAAPGVTIDVWLLDLAIGHAINVISTFLLVALVLPKLKAPAAEFGIRPNLVTTSSGSHKHTRFSQKSEPSVFAALNDERYANGAHWRGQPSRKAGPYSMEAYKVPSTAINISKTAASLSYRLLCWRTRTSKTVCGRN